MQINYTRVHVFRSQQLPYAIIVVGNVLHNCKVCLLFFIYPSKYRLIFLFFFQAYASYMRADWRGKY